jgi:alpha-beta hydrolase superfamily lysophospholipase
VSEIKHRTVETNGIHMHIAESGAGPLVLLCHGFPESWYSWRHQLHALAEAGFHAIAPDMRGYAQTDRPEQLDRYTLLHLIGDVLGLLHWTQQERAQEVNQAVIEFVQRWRPASFKTPYQTPKAWYNSPFYRQR